MHKFIKFPIRSCLMVGVSLVVTGGFATESAFAQQPTTQSQVALQMQTEVGPELRFGLGLESATIGSRQGPRIFASIDAASDLKNESANRIPVLDLRAGVRGGVSPEQLPSFKIAGLYLRDSHLGWSVYALTRKNAPSGILLEGGLGASATVSGQVPSGPFAGLRWSNRLSAEAVLQRDVGGLIPMLRVLDEARAAACLSIADSEDHHLCLDAGVQGGLGVITLHTGIDASLSYVYHRLIKVGPSMAASVDTSLNHAEPEAHAGVGVTILAD